MSEIPSLYEYQEEGVEVMLQRRRMILADAMGLGKTAQVLELAYRSQAVRILAVVPNRLKVNFRKQCAIWYPEAPVYMCSGTTTEKAFAISTFEDGILIINYETIRPVNKEIKEKCKVKGLEVPFDFTNLLQKHKWDLIIFDEAHRLGNRKALQTAGARTLAKLAPYVILMSGTPVQNRIGEIWSLLHLVNPKKFSSYWDFMKRHADARPGIFGWVMEDAPVDPEALHAEIAPYIIRREKEPGTVTVQEIEVDLEGEQLRMYDEMEVDAIAQLDLDQLLIAPIKLAQITRCRQLCISPRLVGAGGEEAKLELLNDILDGTDEKVLIFSQWEKVIRLVAERLNKRNIQHVELIGGLKDWEQAEREDIFQNDPNCRCVLGTIDAMGEGLTLTAGSVVIFIDKHWNPQKNNQCVARADRDGQTKPVKVYYLKARNTVEEWIDDLIAYKEGITQDLHGRVQEILDALRLKQKRK